MLEQNALQYDPSRDIPAVTPKAPVAHEEQVTPNTATEPRLQERETTTRTPSYQRLTEKQLSDTWPSPIADTDPWIPLSVALSAEPIDAEGNIRLRFSHDAYQPFSLSRGPGAIKIFVDHIEKRMGAWSPEIMFYKPRI